MESTKQQSQQEEKKSQINDKERQEKTQMLLLFFKTMTAMRLSKDDCNPAEIIDGLYLGSIGAAYNKESLQKHSIKYILTCADNLKPRYPNDFEYFCLPLKDSPQQDITQYFQKANDFIDAALAQSDDHDHGNKQTVLVHCFAGKSRSTSFVLAYLMERKKITLKEGLDRIRALRPIAEPNPGFMFQLSRYEKEIFGKNSMLPEVKTKIQDEEKQAKLDDQLEPEVKEITDSIEQMNIVGDKEGASEIQSQLKEITL